MAFNLNKIPFLQRATPEQRQARLEICATCPDRLFNGGLLTCKKCGCAMRFKTWLRGASCPVKKWEEINVTEQE